MSITIVCGSCGKTGAVPVVFRGQRVVCPMCNHKFTVSEACDGMQPVPQPAVRSLRVPEDQAEILVGAE